VQSLFRGLCECEIACYLAKIWRQVKSGQSAAPQQFFEPSDQNADEADLQCFLLNVCFGVVEAIAGSQTN